MNMRKKRANRGYKVRMCTGSVRKKSSLAIVSSYSMVIMIKGIKGL
jgi:hypothetical protein